MELYFFKFIVTFLGQFATDREAEIHTETLSIVNTNSINVLWSFYHPIVIKFESDRHVLLKTLSIKPNKNPARWE
jgi:hypothetical protein